MISYHNLDLGFFDTVGKWEFPRIKPFNEKIEVKRWIGFDHIHSISDYDVGCHFYVDDYKFDRVWNRPLRYLKLLKKCKYVISTDFSIYTDFPKILQAYNIYRNAWLARFFQENDIKVIPNVRWGDESTYDWIFECFPKNSIIAISSKGMMRTETDKKLFFDGYEEMIKRLNPSKILCFTCNKIDLGLGDNVEYIRMDYLKGLFERS